MQTHYAKCSVDYFMLEFSARPYSENVNFNGHFMISMYIFVFKSCSFFTFFHTSSTVIT